MVIEGLVYFWTCFMASLFFCKHICYGAGPLFRDILVDIVDLDLDADVGFAQSFLARYQV